MPTCKARLLWCLKFSLQLNIITGGGAQNILVEKKIIEKIEGKLPKYFGPANLTHLFVDPFVTWDDVHRKDIRGSYDSYILTPYKYHIMKFPHSDNGKLDVLNGAYSR